MKKIIYEPHPVTPERKAQLVAEGYKIVDAVFAPAEGGESSEKAPKSGRAKAKEPEA